MLGWLGTGQTILEAGGMSRFEISDQLGWDCSGLVRRFEKLKEFALVGGGGGESLDITQICGTQINLEHPNASPQCKYWILCQMITVRLHQTP